jgi:phosphatidylglycerophosphate synthase
MSSGFVREQNALTTVTFVDPIAIPLSRLLARIGISPNAITLASALTSVLTAILFADGGRITLAVGGVVFYVSFLLDCVDGKVARLTDTTSEFGAKFDLYLDSLRKPLIFPGLLYGHFYTTYGVRGLALGILLVGLHYAGHLLYNRLVNTNTTVEKREHFPAGGYESRELSGLNQFLKRHGVYCTPYTKPDEQFVLFVIMPLLGLPVIGMVLATALFVAVPISAELKAYFFGGSTW